MKTLLDHFDEVRRHGDHWSARCPNCSEPDALTVSSVNGKPWVSCGHKCAPHDVLAAIGLTEEQADALQLDCVNGGGPTTALAHDDPAEVNLERIGVPVPGKVRRVVCAADLRKQGSPDLDFLPFLGRDGYIVRGWTTLIAAYPKVGKTELLARLCHEWRDDRILYVTEEPESIWSTRLRRSPEGWEHVFLMFGLGMAPKEILGEIDGSGASVVIIDTIRNLLNFRDETDNSEVKRVLTPYIAACRSADRTFLPVHHIRKGGGEHGEGITGGHAFLGIVDASIEILRDSTLGENRRRVRGESRIHLISDLMYAFEDGRMRALGDPEAVKLDNVKQSAADILNGEWLTLRDIYAVMDEPKPSERQLREALNALLSEGSVERDPAEERRGATYHFRLAGQPHPERLSLCVPGSLFPGEGVGDIGRSVERATA